jgi:metal-sulfur cluster biosynthetic enzyme
MMGVLAMDEELRERILAALDTVIDPCSARFGAPLGLVGMGIVRAVELRDGVAVVTLAPTFPDCLFLGHFDLEIRKALREVDLANVAVRIDFGDVDWDEDRLSPMARAKLADIRGRRRSAVPRPIGLG